LLLKEPTISVQVLNEVTSVCHRKLRMSWTAIRQILAVISAACRVVPLTEETHARAVHLASQHKLPFCDAHILAAAVTSGAHTLMSEDMQAGWVVQGLEIRNPFLG